MSFGFLSERLSKEDKKFYLSMNIRGEYSSKELDAPKAWVISENRDMFLTQNEEPNRWQIGCRYFDFIYNNEVCKIAVIIEVEQKKVNLYVKKIRIEKTHQPDELLICDAIKEAIETMAKEIKPEYEIVEWPEQIEYHFVMPRKEREKIAKENEMYNKKAEIEIAQNIEKAKREYGNGNLKFMPELKKNKAKYNELLDELESDVENDIILDTNVNVNIKESIDDNKKVSEIIGGIPDVNEYSSFKFELGTLSKSDRSYFETKGFIPEQVMGEIATAVDFINKIYLIDDEKTMNESIKHMMLIYKDVKNDFYVKVDMQGLIIVYKIIGYEMDSSMVDNKELIFTALKEALKRRSEELQMNCKIEFVQN